MQGIFKSAQACKQELYNQGFIFYVAIGVTIYFRNKAQNSIAEIVTYPDGSSSALIGAFYSKK